MSFKAVRFLAPALTGLVRPCMCADCQYYLREITYLFLLVQKKYPYKRVFAHYPSLKKVPPVIGTREPSAAALPPARCSPLLH